MSRHLTITLFALFAVAPVAARPNGGGWLFEAQGLPGQTVDALMLEVAPRLRAFADQTGFESCAEIGRGSDGRYGVVVTTSRSKTVCAIEETDLPAGMVSTGESIHSHGRDEAGSMGWRDLKLRGEATDARTASRSRISGQRIDYFSEADLGAEPGYLAIPGGLIYHDGHKRVRRVVSLPVPKTIPAY